MYISDWINLRIRVVDTAGIIHTLAGTGLLGYNGDRLAPNQTNIFPAGLTFGPAGQLYFSDSTAFRVRKIDK